MTDPIKAALALWDLQGACTTFIAGRENRVYRVEAPQGTFALRFKRPGYRSDAELTSELQWMAAMDAAGLSVPHPLPSTSGALLERIGDQRFDVLSWLPGQPITHLSDPKIFTALGQDIARLHDASDAWSPPHTFTRCAWNADGLLGDAPLWGRFWDNPTLDPDTKTLLETFRTEAKANLTRQSSLDYGLIHADLVGENVLRHNDSLTFIDFDDGGFGYRLFDLATVLLKRHKDPDFQALKTALITGYQTTRRLDVAQLDLFLALRAVTYVGWIIPRIHEDGGQARAQRFTETARVMCTAYLDAPSPGS